VQEPVGERSLPVVNVGDDAEITYVCGVHCFSGSERDRIDGNRLKKSKFAGQLPLKRNEQIKIHRAQVAEKIRHRRRAAIHGQNGLIQIIYRYEITHTLGPINLRGKLPGINSPATAHG